jgi:hypothetical protein
MRAAILSALLLATALASAFDLRGTYKAKVVWIGKSIPTPMERAQIQQIEKHLRLILLPNSRYFLADNKLVYEGTWQMSNGQLVLIGKPTRPGGPTQRVSYQFSKDLKTIAPKIRQSPSYIGFVKSSTSTKL